MSYGNGSRPGLRIFCVGLRRRNESASVALLIIGDSGIKFHVNRSCGTKFVWCRQVGRVFRPAGRIFVGDENGSDGLFSRSFRPRCVHPTRWEKYGAIVLCVWVRTDFRGSPWIFMDLREATKKEDHDELERTPRKLQGHVYDAPDLFVKPRASLEVLVCSYELS